MGDEQAGFRKNSGTREGIFNLKMIVEKNIETQKDIYACFIDYSKAFNTVNHEKMIECLKTTDIDQSDIALIANLYWEQDTKIRIGNDMSESLKIKRGVTQGCVLSPSLFNLYTEHIFRQIDELQGVKIGGRNINNLRYADDTVLLAETEEDLQKIVDQVKRESESFGLLMNAKKKTKTMVFSKSSNPPNTRIHIEGKLIEKVQTFTYLGALMTEVGRSEKEIKIRINIAKRTFQQKSKLLTSHDLSYATKMRLVKCYIWATFLYGCETWTLTESIEKKITAFEMWIYRRISRIPWTDKVTNQHVLQEINIKSTELVQMIRTRKVKFYGHVRRHDSLQRVILEGKVEGKRGRGRKRTSWTDNIKTHLGLPINTCAELALDRKKWRAMTPNLGSEKEPG